MRTLWQASSEPTDWRAGVVPPLLPIWWTLWLVSNALGLIEFRIWMGADTIDEMLPAQRLSLWTTPVDLALWLAAYHLVGRIWEAQSSRAYGVSPAPQDRAAGTS